MKTLAAMCVLLSLGGCAPDESGVSTTTPASTTNTAPTPATSTTAHVSTTTGNPTEDAAGESIGIRDKVTIVVIEPEED